MPGFTHALANDSSRCRLYNLGSDEHGGGPFAVAQTAYDPEDPRMAEAVFVLLSGGRWIDQLALAELPEENGFDHLFASSAEAILEMESLRGPVEIVRFPLTEQDLRERAVAWREGGFEQRARTLVERYRARQRP